MLMVTGNGSQQSHGGGGGLEDLGMTQAETAGGGLSLLPLAGLSSLAKSPACLPRPRVEKESAWPGP